MIVMSKTLIVYPATVELPMGDPLHYSGQCQTTGCMHCSRCELGPQYTLISRYTAGRTDALPMYEMGLCPRCAGVAVS